MVQSREETAVKIPWVKTPAGIKSKRISCWKNRGIRVEYNDWNYFYEIFISITECQKCGKELAVDKQRTHATRCVDHDHTINDEPNVRYICCHSCNTNDKSGNTSGEANIHQDRKYWVFKKRIQGKEYSKSGFKTFEEAVQYKKQFLENLSV